MDHTVRATWDAEASVWVAESDDVPGLITEAADLEALMSKLRVMVPELLVRSAGERRPRDRVQP
jgi:predicted RNase H-like HicB family nuclease